jgi:hypothetical protein
LERHAKSRDNFPSFSAKVHLKKLIPADCRVNQLIMPADCRVNEQIMPLCALLDVMVKHVNATDMPKCSREEAAAADAKRDCRRPSCSSSSNNGEEWLLHKLSTTTRAAVDVKAADS